MLLWRLLLWWYVCMTWHEMKRMYARASHCDQIRLTPLPFASHAGQGPCRLDWTARWSGYEGAVSPTADAAHPDDEGPEGVYSFWVDCGSYPVTGLHRGMYRMVTNASSYGLALGWLPCTKTFCRVFFFFEIVWGCFLFPVRLFRNPVV